MHISEQDRKYFRKYYSHLKGCKIVGTGFSNGFPYFTAEKDGQRFKVEISQDPEGNGPGFLFGLPIPAGGGDGWT